MNKNSLLHILLSTVKKSPLQLTGLIVAAAGVITTSLLPPLVLERIVNALAQKDCDGLIYALIYFAALAVSGLFESLKEASVTVFGQRLIHSVRKAMCKKLSRLGAGYFTKNDPGAVVSRFVSDVETLEVLFSAGIAGMAVDAFKIIGILAVVFIKSTGLGLLMLPILPLLFLFTRAVQKRMFDAHLKNRRSIALLGNHIPETIRCIRMIHGFGKEKYMRDKYGKRINESYEALERVNFFDAIYSPVILVVSALIIAVMMVLAATGGEMQSFFGMSVGTAVAVTAFVGRIFEPLESIGMEIQSIQSAGAGVKRIKEFLDEPERVETDNTITPNALTVRNENVVELSCVTFGYGEENVLNELSLTVKRGEAVTLAGRTGAGKSTVIKLILGLYSPSSGSVRVFGAEADLIPDVIKRRLFGYVEQSFKAVPGTVYDQIAVFDESITQAEVEKAASLSGIHETITALPDGYMTVYADSLFSQGQKQLLAIARATAANPEILLLDEITANLDSDTEERVLSALKNASARRTVLSVSHRLYEKTGGRVIEI